MIYRKQSGTYTIRREWADHTQKMAVRDILQRPPLSLKVNEWDMDPAMRSADQDAGIDKLGETPDGETLTIGMSCAPLRKRMRRSPSRRSISLRSCRPMSRTRYLMERRSKGLGILEGSSATAAPTSLNKVAESLPDFLGRASAWSLSG